MRVLLLLIILGVLILFAIQNTNPVISLTILGVKTLALPLWIWILGAIAAGAITALLTGALIRLGSGGRSSRRRSSGKGRRGSGSGPAWNPPPWTGRNAEPQDTVRASSWSRSNQDDDWGRSSSNDDWDDWARGEEAPRTQNPSRSAARPPVSPPIRDAEFRPLDVETVYPEPDDSPSYSGSYDGSYRESYSDFGDRSPYTSDAYPSDYSPPGYEESAYEENREVWDDWEEEPARPNPPPPPPEEAPPARDIVEIRRDPQSTQRTGTIYSFSYRSEDEPPIVPEAAPSSTPEAAPSSTDVSDPPESTIITPPPLDDEPRIRVIIPPYRSTPPASEPSQEEEDDWEDENGGFEDDNFDDGNVVDNNRESGESDEFGDREVWDDWEEDSDEPDDSPGRGSSPRSPRDNPPLKF